MKDYIPEICDPTEQEERNQWLVLGYISGVFGIKGWVKVYSYTQKPENILKHPNWFIKQENSTQGQWFEINNVKQHGKILIAHMNGCDDRNCAQTLIASKIMIKSSTLPLLSEQDVYWHQLEKMWVHFIDASQQRHILGKVDHLIATGANDVLVVHPTAESIDKRQRLIPWVMNQVILNVDKKKQIIHVNWPTDY